MRERPAAGQRIHESRLSSVNSVGGQPVDESRDSLVNSAAGQHIHVSRLCQINLAKVDNTAPAMSTPSTTVSTTVTSINAASSPVMSKVTAGQECFQKRPPSRFTPAQWDTLEEEYKTSPDTHPTRNISIAERIKCTEEQVAVRLTSPRHFMPILLIPSRNGSLQSKSAITYEVFSHLMKATHLLVLKAPSIHHLSLRRCCRILHLLHRLHPASHPSLQIRRR